MPVTSLRKTCVRPSEVAKIKSKIKIKIKSKIKSKIKRYGVRGVSIELKSHERLCWKHVRSARPDSDLEREEVVARCKSGARTVALSTPSRGG